MSARAENGAKHNIRANTASLTNRLLGDVDR